MRPVMYAITIIFTQLLIEKVKNRFNVDIPKNVLLNKADKVAELLIEGIIKPNV